MIGDWMCVHKAAEVVFLYNDQALLCGVNSIAYQPVEAVTFNRPGMQQAH
jgi:hypothetical protein